MKKLITLSILLSTLLLISVAWSQDFQKGEDAYIRGDYATALREWKPLAEQGDADAQTNLGLMYVNGLGVPQDYKQAVKWYRRAAEQGHASVQFNLGLKYDNGQGVPQDYKQALQWYQRAAEQGHASAQYNLGVMYVKGKGVPKDYVLAYIWINLAAAQNSKNEKARNILEKEMAPSQLEKGQRLSRECLRKNYKGC